MNTKGKIDFTKTDNIQFIEEVASEISKEDKNWQWEAQQQQCSEVVTKQKK